MKRLSMSLKRFLCRLMVVVMIIGQLPISSFTSYAANAYYGTNNTDYRAWSQDQLPWGIERLGADENYGGFNWAGCLVTALAKLSVQLEARTIQNMNPGIANTTFTKAGIMDTDGNLTDWKKAAQLLGMTYEGKISYDQIIPTLKKTDKNYGIILEVGGAQHYVPVDKETTIAKNEIYIHDSWSSDPQASTGNWKKSWLNTNKATVEKKYKTNGANEKYYKNNLVSKKYLNRFKKSGTSVMLLSTPKGVTISFNGNGGTVSKASTFVKKDANYYAELPTATRDGYTFKGWYTAKSGGTKITTSNAKTSQNTTIYAQWTANPKYKVTLNANGGKVSGSSSKTITVTKGLTYSGIVNPTRSGYTFQGWYTKKSGGTKITKDTKVTLTGKQTLYAHWLKNYKVTLNANNGKVSPSSLTVVSGKTYANLPTPTRSGYTFKGWYTTKLIGGSKVSNATKVTKNHTLYARWTKNPATFTVKLNANGGSVSKSSFTVKEGKTYASLPTPTRSGFTFDGWYTAASGGSKVSTSTKVTKSHTLYAHWKAVKTYFKVTLDPNGGTMSGSTSMSIAKGQPYGSLPTPTRVGYKFKGWYKPFLLIFETQVGSSTKVEESHTLTAKWEACSHSYNGGICKTCTYEWPYWNNVKSMTSTTYKVSNKDGGKVWSRPYSNNSTNVRILSYGTQVTVVGSVKNTDGNTWYKMSDGKWIFSGNVEKYTPSLTCVHSYKGGICKTCKYEWPYWNNVSSMSATVYKVTRDGAPIWNRPYSNNSSQVATRNTGALVTVVGQVKNTDGNYWYKLSNGNWIYSGNVAKASNIYYVKGASGGLCINSTTDYKTSFTGVIMPNGAPCERLWTNGNWWWISYTDANGKITKGYASSNYLKTSP